MVRSGFFLFSVMQDQSFLFLRPRFDQVLPSLRRARSILHFLRRARGSVESDAPRYVHP
jgi:hypothetical protein